MTALPPESTQVTNGIERVRVVTMSLTSHIADKTSPVPRFLNEHFPFIKSVQASYLAGAPELQFPPCSANHGTVGTAYDWRVRLLVDLHPDVHLPVIGVMRTGRRDLTKPLIELLAELGIPIELDLIGSRPAEGASGVMAQKDEELLSRLAWVLAAYTELFRCGMVFPGSPLSRLGKKPNPADLLALAPEEVCSDLAVLVDATKRTLLPVIEQHPPVQLGPTFACSASVGGADADIVAGGLLVDLKTSVGAKRSDGSPSVFDWQRGATSAPRLHPARLGRQISAGFGGRVRRTFRLLTSMADRCTSRRATARSACHVTGGATASFPAEGHRRSAAAFSRGAFRSPTIAGSISAMTAVRDLSG